MSSFRPWRVIWLVSISTVFSERGAGSSQKAADPVNRTPLTMRVAPPLAEEGGLVEGKLCLAFAILGVYTPFRGTDESGRFLENIPGGLKQNIGSTKKRSLQVVSSTKL